MTAVVTVVVADEPAFTATPDGDTATEKSLWLIVTVKVVECDPDPALPVTVTV